ncbi:MAG: DSD1 family PLP-dependent enzyme [Betaproteobacteria bacterium]|nr:DSD1 family PLP-dependent enzyme [Betaproteobacteria bacterium]
MSAKQEEFAELDTPALLLDLDQVERNIDRYQRGAASAGLQLRPHAKAHKCSAVGRIQVERGAVGLCCAKLGEAEAMAAGGVRDLLVTTPVVGGLKIRRLVDLARSAKVAVVVDDESNIAELAQAAGSAGVQIDVLVEVDVGQARAGVAPGPRAAELATVIARSRGLRFRGLQGYQGKLQAVASFSDRDALVREAMGKLRLASDGVRAAGLDCTVATGGGTGSFPIDIRLGMLTELQPGSYVTMDTAYAKVALAGEGDEHPLGQPLTILASVISKTTAGKAIVDVGWKSASSDGGLPSVKNRSDLIFEFAGDEHGSIRSSAGELNLALGDRIELIPSHCDTTVNLYDRFAVHRSGRLEGFWTIEARGKSQ